jgi:hypothetical protein
MDRGARSLEHLGGGSMKNIPIEEIYFCCVMIDDEVEREKLMVWRETLEPFKSAIWTCPGCGQRWEPTDLIEVWRERIVQ